jgi:esterase/lipase superfamily enzyme
MKPFHLHVHFSPKSGDMALRWYGASAIHAQGARDLTRQRDAQAIVVSEDWLIDLNPLLAEVAAGVIADSDALRAADELLQLRDLLTDADFSELCDALFRFLYQESQTAYALESVRTFDSGRKPVRTDHNNRVVRVWFGTDRKPLYADDIGQGFSAFGSADEITYGVCNVFIPESHEPGSTGSPWWRRWFVLRADDRLQVRGLQGMARDVFWRRMARTMETWWNAGERNVFVLVHGYNVSFEDGAKRAAQLGYDLKLPGEIAFYSWPSRGATADYMADEATISASSSHIARFLHELCARSGAERIHLLVHSMGNRGVLSALERIVARKQPQLRLGQVFFCAPDEDVRTFRDKITEFPHVFENRTLLVSPEDKAVAASHWLRNQDRVGIVPPVITYPEMETIEVGGFGILKLGHGYFAEAKPLILDIREAIATRKRAADRTIPTRFEEHFVIDIRKNG